MTAPSERRARGAVQRAVYGTATRLGAVDFLRARYTSAYKFAPHSHPVFAVGVVREGACRIWHRGASHVASAGDLVLMNPGDPHSAEAATDGVWEYDAIYFDAEAAASWCGGHVRAQRFGGVVRSDRDLAGRLSTLCRVLEDDPSRSAEDRFRLLARDLFLRFGVRSHDGAAPPEEYVRAREYIEANYHRPVPLQALAELTGQSPFALVRGFSRAWGMPPHRYLVNVRVAHARALLRAGHAITDTAMAVGFCDQSHLTRFFRGITGVPPGVYARGIGGASPGA
jgi:AraC-like DNA-binding protein